MFEKEIKSDPRLLLIAANAVNQVRNFRASVLALGLLRHPALPAEILQDQMKSRAPPLAQVVYKDDAFTQYIMPAPNVENFPRDDRPHDVHPGDIDLGGDVPGDDDPGGDDLGGDDPGGADPGGDDIRGDVPGGVDPGAADPRGDAPEGDA